jgi:hypothetical protein
MTSPMFPTVPENGSPARTEGDGGIFTVPEPAPAAPAPKAPEPATEDTFTHYVHLADGRVLRADLSKITEHIGNRYYENRGEDSETSTEIIGVYPR